MSFEYQLDKKIKIFKLQQDRDGAYVVTIKKYIHPLNSKLCAYFRDLSQKEVNANKQSQDDSTAIFVINRRAVTQGMFIEYKRKTFGLITYQITGVDGWNDNSNLLKLNCKVVSNSINYTKEEGTDYD